MSFRKMFKNPNALKAAEVLSDQISAVKSELKKLQGQCELLQVDDNNQEDLEKEVIELANEAEVLKKSAPEANDDSNIQYFLAIAELEKSTGVLRQQEKITKDNLQSLDQDIEMTRKLLKELVDMKNALADMKTNNENDNPNQKKVSNEAQEIAGIDNQIRKTRKIYKEFKSFLGDYLSLADPVDADEGGNLSNLLQEMWNAYQSKESEDSYVKMSFQQFDVAEKHVNILVSNQIAELHPDDNDLIRLVDFTA